HLRNLPPFPTRRSSDLLETVGTVGTTGSTASPAAAVRPPESADPHIVAAAAELPAMLEELRRARLVVIRAEAGLAGLSLAAAPRSEEHTSELQSLAYLV